MSDIYSKSKRSDIMSKISGKETKPEILVRKFLFSKGFRFRKNVKILPGKPDIVLPKYKTVIFVHGCFWHGHSCQRGTLPETNHDFWQEKIGRNIERDIQNIAELKRNCWNVIIVWQCEIGNKTNKDIRLNKLVEEIKTYL
ncbi:MULTISPECIES: very short patch repair endonuclease [unclassified Dysgonomonas]|uniref:very short patch repair endonuclease n=1 Tax=unclassified Dysgonomonas TaxID=2630389 RepID=UPI0013D18B95|nr:MULTISPECIES: DNA mismatch endonuclease Vsr [unclassified Dysgonomonas]NDV80138.1 DNA mismatch endonuclease Vsr [Dysgonomonas sp. 511]NDW08424.1 DNA mismatch endonuclease Vsr [Dysgonomonas sp. 520]